MCSEVCVLRPYQLLRQMNVYGALAKWYWQGKIKALGKKASPRAILSTTNPKDGSKWHDIKKGHEQIVRVFKGNVPLCRR